MPYTPPPFLVELLEARSPTGAEYEAQAVLDRHLKPAADTYDRDPLGNRYATLNPNGNPTLLLAGHMDELGLIIKHDSLVGYCQQVLYRKANEPDTVKDLLRNAIAA